jgi:cell fate (sporulation/competence/biofilm development) regulator YmcA (YheA/YmcA/DUF963 family)
LTQLNSDIEIIGIEKRVKKENVLELLKDSDAIVDCVDNFHIAMDFRNAIEAIQNKTDIQKNLISRLKKLQQTAVSYQRNVKSQSAEDEDFFIALRTLANSVYESSLCHFNSLIMV